MNHNNNSDSIDLIKKYIIFWCESNACCPRCTLRFTGNMQFSNYLTQEVAQERLNTIKKSIDNSNSIPIEDNSTSVPKPNMICVSCLNLLSPSNLSRVISLIETKLSSLNSNQRQFDSFHLNIFLPVIITLRHEVIIRKLTCELEKQKMNFDFGTILNVKDILRNSLIHTTEESLNKSFDINSSFTISLTFTYDNLEKECQKLLECSPQSFFHKRCRKSIPSALGYLNQASIVRALDAVVDQIIIQEWPLNDKNITTCEIKEENITFSREAIYLAGRYNKYSRELSQTPWIIDGEKKMETSVEEIIEEQVIKHIPNKGIKFSSSGREDVDVMMLGNGRPFVLEISDPQIGVITQELVSLIQRDIKASTRDVSVRDFQLANKDDINTKLKQGEECKTKTYQAVCILSRPFTSADEEKIKNVRDLVIHQKTPIRVLHRRTLSTRKRMIHSMSSESLSDQLDRIPIKLETHNDLPRMFVLNLTTEAGCYVKEFVHSDFGRTDPSLAVILGDCEVDIIQLDVMEVNLDWPPIIDQDIS